MFAVSVGWYLSLAYDLILFVTSFGSVLNAMIGYSGVIRAFRYLVIFDTHVRPQAPRVYSPGGRPPSPLLVWAGSLVPD